MKEKRKDNWFLDILDDIIQIPLMLITLLLSIFD
jgi:hypothetical protein